MVLEIRFVEIISKISENDIRLSSREAYLLVSFFMGNLFFAIFLHFVMTKRFSMCVIGPILPSLHVLVPNQGYALVRV